MIINDSLKKSPFFSSLVGGLRANNLDISVVASNLEKKDDPLSLLKKVSPDSVDDIEDDQDQGSPLPLGSIHQSVLATIAQKKEEALANQQSSQKQNSPLGPSNITKDGLPIYDKPSNGLYLIQKSNQIIYLHYLNDQKNGEARVCDLDENPRITLNYVDDIIQGEVCMYGENQNLEAKLQYANNKKNGAFTTYYENGIKMNTGFFVDDLQEGESVFFDMYGDICQKSFYTNNKKHGMCITYFPKSSGGGVSQRAEYNNGVLVGKQEMFYTTGELLQVTPYNQGKAQEYTRSFNQKGGLLVDPAIK